MPSYFARSYRHERHHVRRRLSKSVDDVRLLPLAEGELVDGPNREEVLFSFAANVDHGHLVLQGSNSGLKLDLADGSCPIAFLVWWVG